MGITKDYFLKPITVPITLLENVLNEDGTVTQNRIQLIFKLRRESTGESNQVAIAAVLGTASHAELRLTQFANLLIEAPTGFDDFPAEGDLKARAIEYFAGEQYEALLRAVMIFYEQSTTPLEAYRSV